MKIAIIGTGYVGLPTGVCLAELGNEVVCIDQDQDKINQLKNGELTLFEDGLEDLFARNVAAGRITFTTIMKEGVENADVVMIAVGTPPHPVTKEADMKYIHAAAVEMAQYLTGYTVVATKSTVPVGTGDDIEQLIAQYNSDADFDVVSLPEFLREGFALHDFFNPDRIVVGTNSAKAQSVMKELYRPFEDKSEIMFVSRRSSETIKYASNAFLAMKIHYINEMADFCEQAGADIREVAQGIGMDSRIGRKFLNAGPGYGGSCFPKDTNAMAYMARQNGVELTLVEATIKGNNDRKALMARKILSALNGVDSPQIAVFGLAFKGGTDDCRESPAIDIVQELLTLGITIKAFDPQASANAKKILGDAVTYASSAIEAANGVNAVVILTEWAEFKNLDFKVIQSCLRGDLVIDLRNLLNPQHVEDAGLRYMGIGYKSELSVQSKMPAEVRNRFSSVG